MSTRMATSLVAICVCASIMGCSVVLAPSRRQVGGADSGAADANLRDGGPEVDGSRDGGADASGDAGPPTDAAGDGGTPDAFVVPDTGPGDAGPLCPPTLECASAAPAGWNGPVLLVTGAGDVAAPACPGGAPATAFTARSGLVVTDPTCGCTCSAPRSGMTCGSGTIRNSGSMCITVGTAVATFADGECRSVSLPSTGNWTVTRPAFSPGSATCSAVPSTVVPPLTWAASHRGCGFGTPAACGTGTVCVPERTAGERLCVYVKGDATCPPGFPEPLSVADDATDTRGCTACSCGAVTGMCGGSITITNGCPGTLALEDIAVGGCTPARSITGSSGSADFTPAGTCAPTAPTPTGSVTQTTPRTVCCAAE